jgi:hypothetical protein
MFFSMGSAILTEIKSYPELNNFKFSQYFVNKKGWKYFLTKVTRFILPYSPKNMLSFKTLREIWIFYTEGVYLACLSS